VLPFAGPRTLSRLEDDVLAQAGVTDVIVLAGTNDLGQPPSASAEEVIAGLTELVERLSAARPGRRPLKVFVGTLLPAGGYELFDFGSAETNARRERVNHFIRTSGIGDGVVDFDRAVRDPVDPARLRPEYDSGDHLHPNAAGYRAMARAVRLGALRGSPCRRPLPRLGGS
jgi:lysophospholipase L1-like esterase